MRYLFVAFNIMILGLGVWGTGGCGSATNFCEDAESVSSDFTVTNEDCSFSLNDTFRACFINGEEASITGLVTSGAVVNCTVQADSLNMTGNAFACVFDIRNIEDDEDFTCYAGIDSDGNVDGLIYCNPGSQTDDVLDGCSIEYE